MKTFKYSTFAVILSAGVIVSGCMGAHQGTLDEIGASAHPAYIEAFIDYPGPAEHWAAPATFILHVTTKDRQVEVKIPAQWHPVASAVPVEGRAPSSVLTGDQAREKLGNLAAAMEEDKSTYRGCMYPIRVRLIRADGGVLDKAGCRGQSGWSKSASETVDFFFSKI
jgi:hypothetical protein